MANTLETLSVTEECDSQFDKNSDKPADKKKTTSSEAKPAVITNDPLPGQYEDGADSVQIDGQEEWEVERTLAVRLYRKRKLQYRVKWRGYDEPDDTWYPASTSRMYIVSSCVE
ncbi:hypothetical protein PHISCL_07257 [Aspergillus sclerotialis]|uniref:Chromo domain-containing protein n=1 Tax=Aspergillus sclerotialis TaxID=2070753 RepID=A0A3A2ZGB4_9EURO|nr:hypothetical protein PHISCL_07257 [Aspergillus sclerotialis]